MAIEETKATAPENDEAALDAEIQNSVQAVRAGKELTKDEPKPTPPAETPPAEDKDGEAGQSPTPGETPTKEGETPKTDDPASDLRIPNKGKFESDESYEKRIELFDLVKQRKAAKSDENRQQISDKIDKVKSQIKTLNGSDRINNHLNNGGVPQKTEDPAPEIDEKTAADRARLKEIGGATKEDLEAFAQEQQYKAEVNHTLNEFIKRHTEFKDEDVRDVFFDFVDNNFNWTGKGGKELMTVLELAHESMFKPSETVQERVVKAAEAKGKVDAMQFPGGSAARPALRPDQRKAVDELKGTGMSEEKALELISED